MDTENFSRTKIDEILRSNDIYQTVGVPKDVSSKSDLKKAYYKASLLVHPDKTQEKGAAEAFVKLSNAYEDILDILDGKRSYVPNPQKPKQEFPKKQRKRTTVPGSFDEIFENFFKKKSTHISYEQKKKNDQMIINWYYNRK